eukprot:5950119-Amphidinium_carterae.1
MRNTGERIATLEYASSSCGFQASSFQDSLTDVFQMGARSKSMYTTYFMRCAFCHMAQKEHLRLVSDTGAKLILRMP